MATSEQLSAWKESLLAQRAQGVARVRAEDGSMVEYRSDAEISKAIADLDRRIDQASSAKRLRRINVIGTKGL